MTRKLFLNILTTGVNKNHDRIIGIGIVEAVDDKLTGKNYQTLVKVDKEICAKANEIHGITNQDLLNKKNFQHIVDDLDDYLKNYDSIICHNVEFHVHMLNMEFERAQKPQLKIDQNKTFCTLKWFKKYSKDNNQYSTKNNMPTLCSKFNIPYKNQQKSVLLSSNALAQLYFSQILSNINQQSIIDEEQGINVEKKQNIDVEQFQGQHEQKSYQKYDIKDVNKHKLNTFVFPFQNLEKKQQQQNQQLFQNFINNFTFNDLCINISQISKFGGYENQLHTLIHLEQQEVKEENEKNPVQQKNERLLFFDTETTGLSPFYERIIEIGMVEVINGKFTGKKFHRFLNPQKKIQEAASKVHGIKNEDLENEKTFAELIPELEEFIGDKFDKIIAHNANFDLGFLNNSFIREGREDLVISGNQYFCTLKRAREVLTDKNQKKSLDALTQLYDVKNDRDKHSAMEDAEILANLYLKKIDIFDHKIGNQQNQIKNLVLDFEQKVKVSTQSQFYNQPENLTKKNDFDFKDFCCNFDIVPLHQNQKYIILHSRLNKEKKMKELSLIEVKNKKQGEKLNIQFDFKSYYNPQMQQDNIKKLKDFITDGKFVVFSESYQIEPFNQYIKQNYQQNDIIIQSHQIYCDVKDQIKKMYPKLVNYSYTNIFNLFGDFYTNGQNIDKEAETLAKIFIYLHEIIEQDQDFQIQQLQQFIQAQYDQYQNQKQEQEQNVQL
ncbi:Ribonuclease H-like domain [Pseudocohnilembus persalinus]|uniref:Ribonuclease H-like domain n=1 Tax=Pseudocohnilembus persalinus TaxID=266149 RepID=A0A0V0QYH9_PSEPJ|nr:Ribonuclease H-like domain [Pseudocohnilembus persalinus]|eukprot:KRX07385.1 Ribonuclease H-like domain [Pseudocohnilembus persalinus]